MRENPCLMAYPRGSAVVSYCRTDDGRDAQGSPADPAALSRATIGSPERARPVGESLPSLPCGGPCPGPPALSAGRLRLRLAWFAPLEVVVEDTKNDHGCALSFLAPSTTTGAIRD